MDDPRWSLFSPFATTRCLDVADAGQLDNPAVTSSMRSLEDRISLSWLLHEPTIQPPAQSPFAAIGPPLDPLPNPLSDAWDLFPATPVQHPTPLHATRQRSASLPDVLAFDRMGASPWSIANLTNPRPVTLPGSPTGPGPGPGPASHPPHDALATVHHMLTPCDPLHAMAPLPHLAPAPQAGTAALDELLAKLVALRLQGTAQGGGFVQGGASPHTQQGPLDAAAASSNHPSAAIHCSARHEQASSPTPLDGLPKYAKTVLYKTEPCRGWEAAGSCRYGVRCQFAHGAHELRPVPRQKHKTVVCKTYAANGSCPYGRSCRFLHLEDPEHGSPSFSAPSSRAGSPSKFEGPRKGGRGRRGGSRGPTRPTSPEALAK